MFFSKFGELKTFILNQMKFLKKLIFFALIILAIGAGAVFYLKSQGHSIESLDDVLKIGASAVNNSSQTEQSIDDFQAEVFTFIKKMDNMEQEEFSSQFMSKANYESLMHHTWKEAEKDYKENSSEGDLEKQKAEFEKKVLGKISKMDQVLVKMLKDLKSKGKSHKLRWSDLELVNFLTPTSEFMGMKKMSGEIIMMDSIYNYKLKIDANTINSQWKLSVLSGLERQRR